MRSYPRGGTAFQLDTDFLQSTESLLRSIHSNLNAVDVQYENAADDIELDPLASKVRELSGEWKYHRRDILRAISVLHVCVMTIRVHFEQLDAQLARKAGKVHWE